MHWGTLFSSVLACSTAISASRSLPETGAQPKGERAGVRDLHADADPPTPEFAVNGSAIPDVHFDVGESYAGQLPISSDPKEQSKLFFWFFPSTNPAAKKEIVIWLNGGPGCSSLEGFLQENGPLVWQYGTFRPVANQWGWNTLTNVIWVDQPLGTSFSVGKITAKDEKDVASQFMGFWKNFVDTFDMKGYKVYFSGESYAGLYCPYIADAFLEAKDATYYDVSGMLLYSAIIASDRVMSTVPSVAYAKHWSGFFPFNDTFRASLNAADDSCGLTAHLNKHIVYPPSGPQQEPGTFKNGTIRPECDLFYSDIKEAAILLNPCFNVYQIATTCPLLWDVLGFPGSATYTPEGASLYFDRADVKKAIHAPDIKWTECADHPVFVNDVDNSPPSSWEVLPRVIERTRNVIIGQGALDFRISVNGTRLAIQNMTWGGQLGFQKKPSEPFYVPRSTLKPVAGAGVMGTTHTERGLTFVVVAMSGHMVPQFAPSAAYRNLEFLLGRVKCMNCTEPFTTDKDVKQSEQKLGSGIQDI